ncbi:MAG: AsmA-like C-terminal region-containing protein [Opitutales bacterium]
MKPHSPYYRRRCGGWLECWRWLNTLLCLGLFLALCFQAYVLVFLIRTGQLPVPEVLSERLNQQLAAEGLSLEASEIRISMRGVVLVKDAQLFAIGIEEPIATSEFLQLRLGAMYGLSEVRVSNLNLYCPALHSPTGEREVALSEINGRIQRDSDEWIFNNLRTWLIPRNEQLVEERALRLRVTGAIPVGDEDAAEIDIDRPLELYYQATRQLCALKDRLNVFEEPRLNVQFAAHRDGTLQVRPVFRAESVETADGLRAEDVRIEGSVVLDERGALSVTKPFHGRVSAAWWQDVFTSRSLHFSTDLILGEEGQLPSLGNLHFGAARAVTPERAFSSISGRLNEFQEDRIQGTLVLTEGLHAVELSGVFNPVEKSGEVRLHGRFEPRALFGIDSFSAVPDLAYLVFDDRPLWDGFIRLDPDFRLRDLFVDLTAGGGVFCQARLDSLSLRAYADPEVVRLPSLYVSTREWSVEGSFLHNVDTGHYRLLAQGNVRPEEIADIMPDWWASFWEDYQFDGKLPYGDLDLQGNTRTPDGTTVFVGTRMRELTFRGVDLSEMEAKVWFDKGFLDVFDIYARRPDGFMRGEVQLVYHYGADISHRQHYILETELPLEVLSVFVDDEVKDIFDDFEPSATPRLGIQATLFSKHTPRAEESFVLFEAELDAPVVWRDFPLDWLRLKGDHNPRQLELPQIEFGFAGGTGRARTLWHYHPGPDKMAVALQLDDARAIEALRKVPQLDVDGNRDERLPELPTNVGTMDFRFDGEGLAGDVSTFRAKGLMTIDDTDIRLIPFFSGLTEAVSEQADSPTRLTFTNFNTAYQLSGGLLHLPNIAMRGNNATLRGSGNYNFNDSGLSFKAVVNPFGRVDTPVVSQVFSLFSPLTKTFEVRLYGSVDEPVWRVKFDPFGVVREKGVVRPPEDTGHVANEVMPDSAALGMPIRDIRPLAPLEPPHPLFEPPSDPYLPPAGPASDAGTDAEVASGREGPAPAGS